MTRPGSSALEHALAAHRSPMLYARLRHLPLPDDLQLLLRVLAGDAGALDQATRACGEAAEVVLEASALFVQQSMFYPNSDSYRILGVVDGATDAELKENYRWLVRWLHPDRNNDKWDAVYTDRVTAAWQTLRTPERRLEFDRAKVAAPPPATAQQELAPARRAPARVAAGEEPILSSRTVRRLPLLVAVGMAGVAALILAILWAPTGPEETWGKRAPPVLAQADQAAARSIEPEAPAGTDAELRGLPMAASSIPAPVPPDPFEQVEMPPAGTPAVPLPGPVAPPASAAVARVPSPSMKPPAREAVTPPAPSPTIASSISRTAQAQAPAKPRPADMAAQAQLAAVTQRDARPPQRATRQAEIAARSPATNPVVAPAPVSQLAASRSTAPGLINAQSAQDLIMRFRSAYASGDIDRVRELYVRDASRAVGNREIVMRSYQKLFKSSSSRHIIIRNPSWLTDADTAILIGSYDARIMSSKGAKEEQVSGDIRFDLRSEDGELRIVQLRHGADG